MKDLFKGRPYLLTPVMEERILHVAYGDGSWLDRVIVHHVRKQNPRVEACYQQHLEIASELRLAAAQVKCPDALTEQLLEVASKDRGEPGIALWERLFPMLQGVAAVAAVGVFSLLLLQHSGDSGMERTEIDLATLQARESLALISRIMNETVDTAHQHVILEQTSRPLRESIYKGTETIKNNL
jgi:hypothetical protein